MPVQDLTQLKTQVERAVAEAKITDIHTHLYSPAFGDLLLWGFDELVNYHYLVAETLRISDIPYEEFWALSREQRTDLIWKTLFLDNSPYSEACRGVLTVLNELGLDVGSRDVSAFREYYRNQTVHGFIDKAFEVANIDSVVMTNDPFDAQERKAWLEGFEVDPRFKAALRLDPLLVFWDKSYADLKAWGYDVDVALSARSLKEIRRFLSDWIKRMDPVYMAVSLPSSFRYPADNACAKIIEECVLPVSREHNVPFALMIGVKRQVNPGLRLAGDGLGKSDISAVEYLCANYPDNKFLCTMLSRENQHELAVNARKFRNLLVFGCWWFLNNPSLIEEITRMRFELLGVSVIPQHSDARVLDQVIYKWAHSREIIAKVLVDEYSDLARTGWQVSEDEIRRDVNNLFGGNFWSFLEK